MRIPMTWGINKGLEQLDRDAMMRNDPWSPDAQDLTGSASDVTDQMDRSVDDGPADMISSSRDYSASQAHNTKKRSAEGSNFGHGAPPAAGTGAETTAAPATAATLGAPEGAEPAPPKKQAVGTKNTTQLERHLQLMKTPEPAPTQPLRTRSARRPAVPALVGQFSSPSSPSVPTGPTGLPPSPPKLP